MRSKVAADGGFIERLDAKTEVIEVPSLLRWWRATDLAKLTRHWHEVNQRAPCPKLNQPDGILASFDRAPERPAVKAKHAIKIDDAQYKMVNLTDMDHWGGGRDWA